MIFVRPAHMIIAEEMDFLAGERGGGALVDVRDLEYIIAIAQEGSLSGAGRRLGVSQPTLSAFLAGLERQLGADLFVRDHKRMLPTPAGRICLDAARRIVNVKEQTYQTIHRLTHEPEETIVIGATPLRGSIMVAQIFPQFSRVFPDIKLSIREAYMKELRELVKNGEVNCSLGTCYDTEDPDVDYIIISREEIVLGVPAFHRLASFAAPPGEPLASIDVDQTADSPFVLLAPGTTVRAISDSILDKAGIRPTVVFETNNNLVLSNMIRQGAGVGFLPRSAIPENSGEMVCFSIRPRYYMSLCILHQKNRKMSRAERYLAYLVIRRDVENPLYVPAVNDSAREIQREFDGEGSL